MEKKIKDHLNSGGVVQVTTYAKSIIYDKRHVDMFFMQNGNLHVKRGNRSDQLSNGETLLVGIRFGRYKNIH